MQPLLHIVSHTDMDGVTAAAVAWHAHYPENAPLRVSLAGYGEVDELMLETLRGDARLLVLDLFCQRRETVDEVDTLFPEGDEPLLFDHHKTTEERFGNRKWMVIDTSACAAKVYYDWVLKRDLPAAPRRRLESLADLVDIANDRDLWLGKRTESRLWQALVTLCGPWSVFARLVASPSSTLTAPASSGVQRPSTMRLCGGCVAVCERLNSRSTSRRARSSANCSGVTARPLMVTSRPCTIGYQS